MKLEHIVFGVIIILFIGLKFLIGNSPTEAKKVLDIEGYEKVSFTGYKLFACGNYFHSTGFKGLKNGKEVSGTVCSGLLFKGSLIKYN